MSRYHEPGVVVVSSFEIPGLEDLKHRRNHKKN